MSTLAIIAEYNPFHNGHAYQLSEAKKLTGAKHAVTIMSGNFLQRGEPAMWWKYTRAKMCVSGGIDLAIELPFAYSTGSALDFANGAINILNSINAIDYLCFGIENGEYKDFDRLSDIIIHEPQKYKDILTKELSCGNSYPKARARALSIYTESESLANLVSSPNNILALEYICAIKRTNSRIKPIPIIRQGAGYHDNELNDNLSSATAIRDRILSTDEVSDIDMLDKYVPNTTFDIIKENYNISSPVTINDLSAHLQMARLNMGYLLKSSPDYMPCDMNKDIYNMLINCPLDSDIEDITDKMSCKNYTQTRLRRALLHLILGYTENMRNTFISSGYGYYANILAFKKDNNGLLKQIKTNSNIPVITKKADFDTVISKYDNINHVNAKAMWELDTNATLLYNCMIYNRYKNRQPNDYNVIIPII